MLLPDKLFI